MPTLLAVAAIALLTACTSEETCSIEQAQQKITALSSELNKVATTDPAKLRELAPKVQEFAAKTAAQGDDLRAVCKAMDEMLADLSQ